ncbi:mitochondrial ribosomal protein L41, putative [Plasmodium sp. DRC-Itaito]|uniref:Mitochondrial ribosomal protein L41, putative n=1 Tax=Plasmodium gaboni TaxID=647221 RepID=A0ABY1UK07_9APIC|nr:mitochondrial ribosomal protein L41, putative [Plasmodium sp. gorilla clade G2]SOV12166.1 mitochondrial ribosomal protein L41, putative [Plasmodium gaboni]SOV12340.1 mitochondrial ribosomal protein L41, putative [Plasmodium sp. gorilla clade G2]SOV21552.1 mitochondrial ribosomal protein L41, putative [Plasmodium sp. DRC-Itaito]SOV74582.1 mitochondrial ribosomal protein L41, putative [Plasmodium sp. gorilla clade G3]
MIRLNFIKFAKMGPSKGKGPLIAKYAPVGFKKGFGAIGLGKHTKKGFFIINKMLVPNYRVPDLTDCQLKPYVSKKTPLIVMKKQLGPKRKVLT